jgi:effector-binding domain-containing protein
MASEPEIIERADQPYIAIQASVPMSGLAGLGERLGDVFGWLAARGVAPAGPPFFKYNVIDMAHELEMEAGVPVAGAVERDASVVASVLPGGRYVTSTHLGHPDGLMEATRYLLDWAAARDLKWDIAETPAGERWGSRLEFYLTDPSEHPDMNKWQTQLAFRLAD